MMTPEEQAYVHSLEKTVKEQAKIIEKQTKLVNNYAIYYLNIFCILNS